MSVAFLQHFGGSACPLTEVVPVITCDFLFSFRTRPTLLRCYNGISRFSFLRIGEE
jgi:hypothetical protein